MREPLARLSGFMFLIVRSDIAVTGAARFSDYREFSTAMLDKVQFQE